MLTEIEWRKYPVIKPWTVNTPITSPSIIQTKTMNKRVLIAYGINLEMIFIYKLKGKFHHCYYCHYYYFYYYYYSRLYCYWHNTVVYLSVWPSACPSVTLCIVSKLCTYSKVAYLSQQLNEFLLPYGNTILQLSIQGPHYGRYEGCIMTREEVCHIIEFLSVEWYFHYFTVCVFFVCVFMFMYLVYDFSILNI